MTLPRSAGRIDDVLRVRSDVGRERLYRGASSRPTGSPADPEAPQLESWVEISSRPSSSSLSSAATDEIVTTGLRVQSGAHHRRGHRRRQQQRRLSTSQSAAVRLRDQRTGPGSSQDEYDESESEDDAVMTSSAENAAPGVADETRDRSPDLRGPGDRLEGDEDDEDDDVDDDDDDEKATALGVPREDDVFTPQPNVFSHPPSAHARHHPSRLAPFAPPRDTRPPRHGPYNIISPSHHADHDAALRASLSTLLSCAAAARGLSKQGRPPTRMAGPSAIEPGAIRIVPESAVRGADPAERSAASNEPSVGHRSRASSSGKPPDHGKGKRKASVPAVKGGKERVTKKPKRAMEDTMSPSLFAWVVSAGVVVLVSAIGFSAGYAMGKEVGRAEMSLVDATDGKSCGRGAVRGLKRFRWSTGGTGVVPV